MEQNIAPLTTVRFAIFASQTIAFETGGDKSGAYHLDPSDAGGETKWGISKRAHPNENIKALTFNDALRIYKTQYWNQRYDYMSSDKLAFKVFDMGVLSGKVKAVEILQKAILKLGTTLKVDGVFGRMTLAAIEGHLNQDKLYEKYIELYTKFLNRITFFRPKNRRFINGWLRRLNWVWGGQNK